METILLAARLFLAAVFLLAGVSKLRDRKGSSKAFNDFGLPQVLARPLSLLLSTAEVLVAIALVPVALAWYAACGALALLVLFVGAIGVNLARGRRPDCRCFGQLHSAPVGWKTLARNGVLTALAGWLVLRGPLQLGPPLGSHLASAGEDERRLFIIASCILCFLLFRALRRTEEQPESVSIASQLAWESEDEEDEPEQRPRPRPRPRAPRPALPEESMPPRIIPEGGLPIGTPAPEFELPSMTGETRSLQWFREQGKTIFILFSNPYCDPCRALWPYVSKWMREHEASLSFVVISRRAGKGNSAKLSDAMVSRVLLQREFEISDSYGCTATPAALLIGADGLIQSEVAVGREAIQELIASALKSAPVLKSASDAKITSDVNLMT